MIGLDCWMIAVRLVSCFLQTKTKCCKKRPASNWKKGGGCLLPKLCSFGPSSCFLKFGSLVVLYVYGEDWKYMGCLCMHWMRRSVSDGHNCICSFPDDVVDGVCIRMAQSCSAEYTCWQGPSFSLLLSLLLPPFGFRSLLDDVMARKSLVVMVFFLFRQVGVGWTYATFRLRCCGRKRVWWSLRKMDDGCGSGRRWGRRERVGDVVNRTRLRLGWCHPRLIVRDW